MVGVSKLVMVVLTIWSAVPRFLYLNREALRAHAGRRAREIPRGLSDAGQYMAASSFWRLSKALAYIHAERLASHSTDLEQSRGDYQRQLPFQAQKRRGSC